MSCDVDESAPCDHAVMPAGRRLTTRSRYRPVPIRGEGSCLSGAPATMQLVRAHIVFSHIDSTGSGAAPFFSTLGSSPPGVTFIDNSLD